MNLKFWKRMPLPVRVQIRTHLQACGLRRTRCTIDQGDGMYAEVWTNKYATVTVQWQPRNLS